MVYDRFKRELFELVARSEESVGMTVRLLEKDGTGADAWALVKIHAREIAGGSAEAVREDTLCITWNKDRVPHVLHWNVKNLYERFQQEGWQSVLPDIFVKLRFMGAEEDKLILYPLNYLHHREELRNCIYWRFDEIALVLHAFLHRDGTDTGNVRISRAAAAKWNLPDEILLTNALLGACAVLPPRLYHAAAFGAGMEGYRLTNARGAGGSVCLFYPGIKERLAYLMEGDYYVGFPGIHEVAVHPVRHKCLRDMKAAILRANAMLDAREVLTDRIYRYSCDGKRLIEV